MVVDGDSIPSFSLASLLHDSSNSQYDSCELQLLDL